MSPAEPNFLELFAKIQLVLFKGPEATHQERVAGTHAYNTIIATIYGPEPSMRPPGPCTVGPVKFLPEPTGAKVNV
jgi:hypothetical protein